MWNFLGGLAGGAMNLIGGLFGQSEQEKINQQNIQQAQFMASNAIQMRVNDARKAGINPLAALGSSFSPSPPQLVGSDVLPTAMNQMGQNVERAANAYADDQSKKAQLTNDLLKAQIDQTNVTTAGEMIRNSQLASKFGSVGSPPTVSVPLPRSAPHTADTLPLYQDYRDRRGGRITLLDPEAQRSIFSGVPGAVTFPEISAGLAAENAVHLGDVLRPDVARMMRNLGTVDVSNPWLWVQ